MVELPPRLKVLYPFTANGYDTSDGRLNYVDEGEGPVVVMLHGNPTWSFFYRDLILDLRGSYRCLALDNLGCGLSDKPQKSDYSLAAHVQRTCEWLDALGIESFHLIVHDWGGPIGMGVADRFRDRIKSISLLNTAAFSFPTLPWRIAACRVPFLGALLVRGANAFVRGATRMTSLEPLSEAVKEGYCYPYRNWKDRVAVHAFVRDVPMGPSHRTWKTLKSIENSLGGWRNTPVQICWGMQDWCFHENILKVWETVLPEASVHKFEKAGHYLMEDDGEAVIPEIHRFLDENKA